MSIDEQGFLSDDIVQYRDQIRQRYAQYFDFIHRVNAFCQEAKFRIDGTSANAHNRMAVGLIILTFPYLCRGCQARRGTPMRSKYSANPLSLQKKQQLPEKSGIT